MPCRTCHRLPTASSVHFQSRVLSLSVIFCLRCPLPACGPFTLPKFAGCANYVQFGCEAYMCSRMLFCNAAAEAKQSGDNPSPSLSSSSLDSSPSAPTPVASSPPLLFPSSLDSAPFVVDPPSLLVSPPSSPVSPPFPLVFQPSLPVSSPSSPVFPPSFPVSPPSSPASPSSLPAPLSPSLSAASPPVSHPSSPTRPARKAKGVSLAYMLLARKRKLAKTPLPTSPIPAPGSQHAHTPPSHVITISSSSTSYMRRFSFIPRKSRFYAERDESLSQIKLQSLGALMPTSPLAQQRCTGLLDFLSGPSEPQSPCVPTSPQASSTIQQPEQCVAGAVQPKALGERSISDDGVGIVGNCKPPQIACPTPIVAANRHSRRCH